MRIVLFILILAVAAGLIAVASGYLDISQTREAKAPDVSVNQSGVSASGGQTPTFDVETGSVAVGTQSSNVQVPTVSVTPPAQANGADEEVTANAG